MEKINKPDFSLYKQKGSREISLRILDQETECSPIISLTKKPINVIDLSCITDNRSIKINSKAQEIFDNDQKLKKVNLVYKPPTGRKLVKLTSSKELNLNPKFGRLFTIKEIQQQKCNINIPISKPNKLISDLQVKESKYLRSFKNSDSKIAEHNRKKREFAESKKNWEKQKNMIKKELEIHDNPSTKEQFLLGKHLDDSDNIHDKIQKLNKLYRNSMIQQN